MPLLNQAGIAQRIIAELLGEASNLDDGLTMHL